MRLKAIIKKEFLILINSKISMVIILLGPILLMLILGAGLADNGLKNIPASVFSEGGMSPFTENFINQMRFQSFNPIYTPTLEECFQKTREGKTSVCVELDKNKINIPKIIEVTKKEKENSGIGYSVKIHSDFSKPRVVWEIISKVERVTYVFEKKIREVSENKFKEKTEKNCRDIKNTLTNLNAIINKLQEIKNRIKQTKDSSNIDYEEEIIKSIDGMIETISDLQYYLPVNESEKINEIIWELSSIKKILERNSLKKDSIKSVLGEIENSIEIRTKELIKIRDYLIDIRDNQEAIKNLKWEYITHPIPTTYVALSGNKIESSKEKLEFFDYLFPSLISFFIMLTSIFFATTIVVKEKNSGAYLRNTLSKTPKIEFISATYLTTTIIISIQIILAIFISKLFLHIHIISNLPTIILSVLISTSTFVLIGMLIAYIFNTFEKSMTVAILTSLLLIVFSSLITPLETLPRFLKIIISNTPIVLSETIFRKVLIFDTKFVSNLFFLLKLILTTIVLFFLTWVSVVLVRKKEEKG